MKEYAVRAPRHPSTGATVEVRRSPGGPTDSIGAELVNLSREGFQLRLPLALDEQEMLVMRLCDHDRGVDVMFPAIVRWRREDTSGIWLAGCQTSWQLDLETLGQLFLSEILATE